MQQMGKKQKNILSVGISCDKFSFLFFCNFVV